MFFWYRLRMGRWAAVKSADQPYKISGEEKHMLAPYTDQGLGYYLDMHDRKLSLDELIRKFPPPPPPEPTAALAPKEPGPRPSESQAHDARVADTVMALQEENTVLKQKLKSVDAQPNHFQYISELEQENSKLKSDTEVLKQYAIQLEHKLKEATAGERI